MNRIVATDRLLQLGSSKRRFLEASTSSASNTRKDFAGGAGRVEGGRFLANPEEGELTLRGEILIASTTNMTSLKTEDRVIVDGGQVGVRLLYFRAYIA